MADAAFYNALKPTRLTQGISSTETTVRVAAVEDFSGNAIDSSDIGNGLYGIFEPKTTGKREFFKVTAISGTTLTVARGGLPQAPYTFSGTGVSHAAGVRVILSTNAPALYNTFANKENDESISGLWTFDDAYRPKLDADVDTANATDFITLGQLNRTALGTTLTDRLIVAGTAGATLAAGNLVYFDETDNEWKLTDADTPSTVNNVLLGIAQGAGTNGNAITGGVLLFGIDANQSGMTAGDYMYAGNTAGSISSSPGTTEVTVGIARSATELMFAPRFNQHITEAQQDLLDAITASAAELNILDGYTGTTADLNEASAIVQATDITGAELETLSSGPTSNADARHTHASLKPTFNASLPWNLNTTGSLRFVSSCNHSIAGTTEIMAGVGVSGDTDRFSGARFYSKGGGFFLQNLQSFYDLDYGEGDDTIGGIISIGGVIITSSDDGGVGEIVKEGTGKYTISGTGLTNGDFLMLGFDATNNYLLVWDTATTIHRYSGYAGTTLTYVDEITMPVAVISSGGLGTYPNFCFDDTNNYYIYPDFTNSVIRRVDSVGATVDTYDYTTVLGTERPYGVVIHNGTIYMVVPVLVTSDTLPNTVTFIPTTLTV